MRAPLVSRKRLDAAERRVEELTALLAHDADRDQLIRDEVRKIVAIALGPLASMLSEKLDR